MPQKDQGTAPGDNEVVSRDARSAKTRTNTQSRRIDRFRGEVGVQVGVGSEDTTGQKQCRNKSFVKFTQIGTQGWQGQLTVSR